MAHLKSRGPEMAKLSAPMPSFDRRTVIILLAPAGWERPCQADVIIEGVGANTTYL